MKIVQLAAPLGINLWRYRSKEGGSLSAALAYLRPYNDAPEKWKGNQLARVAPGFLTELLATAARFDAQPQ